MTAVAIFVKTPGLSSVKTRLAAGIGEEAAIRFHLAAAAAMSSVVRACGPPFVPYWAVAERQAPAWPDFPTIWQGEGGLGARMEHVYARLLVRHRSVLLIGADVPQVTAERFRLAHTALRDSRHPYVLGPAADGGFWLFGGRQPVPTSVWRDTPYSQSDTCTLFTRRLRAAGEFELLDELADTDRPDDLPRLRDELRRLVEPTSKQLALADWLETLELTV